MKLKLLNFYSIGLLVLLGVSFGISGYVYFIPQTTTTYPITPFMSYYLKYTYTQGNGEPGASETGTAITIVWLSNIINATTIEISERDINTYLILVPINFTEVKTYQVNLITGKTNNTYGNFLYWILPYWKIANLPSDMILPISIGNYTHYVTSEEPRMVIDLVRNTKVAWFWNHESISVANYDKYSGALIEFKERRGDSIEIYLLQSTVGINLGIDLEYYGLMILLFSLIPGLIIYILIVVINLRKKPEKERVRPLERGEQKNINQDNLKNIVRKEEK